ncbi:tryptophan synthase subunit alpha [Desulfuribacillus alkaliarsenatis]|uniref:Tryptophan synthase alpha chain n=1 Tax=Desulfuribacillus alkaliarsenatis TaxID=766136 RepID=A0A1E5G6B2_9FIRM|nr:tryptophan synthase subunit alpha [Desulfuribacillus alkaliarsenatis]OEF98720.1 tryptophan synthase subunit alpha [Desulfuribacillus alkaliarsenatis]
MNKLFVPFITAGYPSLDITKEIIREFNDMQIPYVELGVPYSDPLADGPTIQRASDIALANGANLDTIFDMISSIAEPLSSKLIIFSYYNPLYVYGFKKFCEKCKKLGIYGVLIPDLPKEEEHEVISLINDYDLVLIPLVTPTSASRLQLILEGKDRGFIYCVSSLGVTGERQSFHSNLEKFIDKVKSISDLPVVVGFGVSSREQAEDICNFADGVIVGSKIINIITNAFEKFIDQKTPAFIAKEVRKNVENICPYVYNK